MSLLSAVYEYNIHIRKQKLSWIWMCPLSSVQMDEEPAGDSVIFVRFLLTLVSLSLSTVPNNTSYILKGCLALIKSETFHFISSTYICGRSDCVKGERQDGRFYIFNLRLNISWSIIYVSISLYLQSMFQYLYIYIFNLYLNISWSIIDVSISLDL